MGSLALKSCKMHGLKSLRKILPFNLTGRMKKSIFSLSIDSPTSTSSPKEGATTNSHILPTRLDTRTLHATSLLQMMIKSLSTS